MSDHYYAVSFNEDHLEHHGILGMKWGVRRYQNPDGTLTEEGKKEICQNNYWRLITSGQCVWTIQA